MRTAFETLARELLFQTVDVRPEFSVASSTEKSKYVPKVQMPELLQVRAVSEQREINRKKEQSSDTAAGCTLDGCDISVKYKKKRNAMKNTVGKLGEAIDKMLNKHNGSISAGLQGNGTSGPTVKFNLEEDLWRSSDGRSKLKATQYLQKELNVNGTVVTSYGVKLALNKSLIPVSPNRGQIEFDVSSAGNGTDRLSFRTSQDLWRTADDENFANVSFYYNKQLGVGGNRSDSLGGQLRFQEMLPLASDQVKLPIEATMKFDNVQNRSSSLWAEGKGELWNSDRNGSFKGEILYRRNSGEPNGSLAYDARVNFAKKNANVEFNITKELDEQTPRVRLGTAVDMWRSKDDKRTLSANAYYGNNVGQIRSGLNNEYRFKIFFGPLSRRSSLNL